MSYPSSVELDNCNPEISIEPCDIANCCKFMDSLVTFLNEAFICMQEVKQRTGMNPDCGSPVKMNDEEKQEKLGSILNVLNKKCCMELCEKNSLPQGKSTDDCSCPNDERPLQRSIMPAATRPASSPSGKVRMMPSQQQYMPADRSLASNYQADYSYGGTAGRGRAGSPYSTIGAAQRSPPGYMTSSYGGGACPPGCSGAMNSYRPNYPRSRPQ